MKIEFGKVKHKLRVQIYELRVQIHELQVPIALSTVIFPLTNMCASL